MMMIKTMMMMTITMVIMKIVKNKNDNQIIMNVMITIIACLQYRRRLQMAPLAVKWQENAKIHVHIVRLCVITIIDIINSSSSSSSSSNIITHTSIDW